MQILLPPWASIWTGIGILRILLYSTAPYYLKIGHTCQKPGCGKARSLVVDGNMKNHRDVCCASYAGYAEYKGLPGRVRTGCPNTPAFKSAYCSIHKPVMAAPHSDGQGDDDNDTREEPIGLILGKRITRTSTMYQVSDRNAYYVKVSLCELCNVTSYKFSTSIWIQVVWLGRPIAESSWEPAATLPATMITEYENGVQRDLEEEVFSSGGQTITTIKSVTRQQESTQPEPKRPCRSTNAIESSNSGYETKHCGNWCYTYIQ